MEDEKESEKGLFSCWIYTFLDLSTAEDSMISEDGSQDASEKTGTQEGSENVTGKNFWANFFINWIIYRYFSEAVKKNDASKKETGITPAKSQRVMTVKERRKQTFRKCTTRTETNEVNTNKEAPKVVKNEPKSVQMGRGRGKKLSMVIQFCFC